MTAPNPPPMRSVRTMFPGTIAQIAGIDAGEVW